MVESIESPDHSENPSDVETLFFEATDNVPNHPDWPLVLYRDVFAEAPSDPAGEFERRYRSHGWGGTWRDGIFPYHHYHSTAHEVLGIARGETRVRFGGPQGEDVTVSAGDAVVLPAGTGHKRQDASRDLLVVGGYPAGQNADLRRADGAATGDTLEAIESVPRPDADPMFGSDGPLIREWHQTT